MKHYHESTAHHSLQVLQMNGGLLACLHCLDFDSNKKGIYCLTSAQPSIYFEGKKSHPQTLMRNQIWVHSASFHEGCSFPHAFSFKLTLQQPFISSWNCVKLLSCSFLCVVLFMVLSQFPEHSPTSLSQLLSSAVRNYMDGIIFILWLSPENIFSSFEELAWFCKSDTQELKSYIWSLF